VKPNLTDRYQILGLHDAGTGMSNYSRWKFHRQLNDLYVFTGSTANHVFVDPSRLTQDASDPLVLIYGPVMADPVGAVEIAERLGVSRDTVDKWRQRYPGFPKPARPIGGRPAWEWPTIEAWYQSRGMSC
jgi:predicted DNA-binding transcriptional regulator AlpA